MIPRSDVEQRAELPEGADFTVPRPRDVWATGRSDENPVVALNLLGDYAGGSMLLVASASTCFRPVSPF